MYTYLNKLTDSGCTAGVLRIVRVTVSTTNCWVL